MRWKLWLGLGLMALLGVVALQNWQTVAVQLLWWKIEMSVLSLVAVVACLGVLSGLVLGRLCARHLKRPG